MHDVLVTGIGPVSAIGIGRAAFAQGLTEGRCAIGPPSRFAGDCPVAEVRDLVLDDILSSQKTILDRASEFALAAAQLALTDGGLQAGDYARWRSGVVMGSEHGCLNIMQLFTSTLQKKGARFANSILFSHMYLNTPASLCAIEFGVAGHHGAYAGANAGAQALESAEEALQLDRADMVLAIGVDAVSEALYRALVAENALAGEALGEGACALLLETAEHAAHRGAAGIPLRELHIPACDFRPFIGNTLAAEPFFNIAARLLACMEETTRC